MSDYTDLLFTADDLTLDPAGEPMLIHDADCITQDIKHLVRDSGLLVEIIGQRDPIATKANLQQLVLKIEEDKRLIPGTVAITRTDPELFFITATTYQYGQVGLEVSV